MLDDLTADESALVDAARDGEVLTRAAPIRAALIRELLLGRRGELDPRGIRLHGARVVGPLELDYVTAPVGLELVDCDIEERVVLAEASLPRLVLTESRIAGIDAEGLRVSGDLIAAEVTVTGAGETGAVLLRGAHIGGQLTLVGAQVSNPDGPAVLANRVHVGGHVLLNRVVLTGAGDEGTLRLANARLDNDLHLANAHLRNDSGPALHADGIHLDGTILLLRSHVSGAGESGAVWLLGAHLAGLRFAESQIHNKSGPALFADQLQATGIVLLQKTTLSGAGHHATIRLAGASAGGQFTVKDNTVTHPDGLLIDVNDFSYGSLAGLDWRQWLDLIRNHTKEYRPSPYQQLAAVERKAGHDGNARNILIAQQQDLRHRSPRALGGWLTQRFHWLWGTFAGYGYRARRTALALLIALAVAGGVSFWAGHVRTGPESYAAERTAAPHGQCSTVELVGLGLDRGLPLGPTGLRSRCDLDTESTAGQVFTVLLWFVQAAVWGLATLALAGYTGLIRKTA